MFFFFFFFAVRLTLSQIFPSLWGILHAQPADFILGAVLSSQVISGKQKLNNIFMLFLKLLLLFVGGGQQTSVSPSHRILLMKSPDLVDWRSPSSQMTVQVTFEQAAAS